jgi:hypothetical protein
MNGVVGRLMAWLRADRGIQCHHACICETWISSYVGLAFSAAWSMVPPN